jgi:hypothetical protein
MSKHLNKIFTQAGKVPNLKSVYAIALYDPNDGSIHHMHHVLIMEGSTPTDPKLLEKEAVAHAEKLGHKVGTLKSLHISDLQDIQAKYRVDVEKQDLIRLSESEQKSKLIRKIR